MLEVEARRLCQILLDRKSVSPLLNLGSSTSAFRRIEQPYVERDLFEPLRRAGIEIVHSDLKAGEGVDVAGDVLDPEVKAALKARGFKCVLAANLLEHVRDREAMASACEEIAGPGGLILATVPSSFPYHADPGDSGYRPSPGALAAAFGRSRALLAEELAGPTYKEELRARGSNFWKAMAATIVRLPVAWARPKSFASSLDRWRWYGRPYRVSIALVRVR